MATNAYVMTIYKCTYYAGKMLKEHIKSITYVVKMLSREVDVVEERLLSSLGSVQGTVRQLQKQQESTLDRVGHTQAQQEHVNTRVREALHSINSNLAILSDESKKTAARTGDLGSQLSSWKAATDSALSSQQRANLDCSDQLVKHRLRMDSFSTQVLRLLRADVHLISVYFSDTYFSLYRHHHSNTHANTHIYIWLN